MLVQFKSNYMLSDLLSHSPFFFCSHLNDLQVCFSLKEVNSIEVIIKSREESLLVLNFFKLSHTEVILLDVVQLIKQVSSDIVFIWLAIKSMLKQQFQAILIQEDHKFLVSDIPFELEREVVSIEKNRFIYIPIF